MDADEAGEDPFGVRLEWPEEQLDKPFDPPAREPEPPPEPEPPVAAPAVEPPTRVFAPPAEPLPVMADPEPLAAAIKRLGAPDSDIGDIPTVLAKIIARVDALTTTTTTYRNLVSDRVSAYTERVVQVVADVTEGADEQRRRSDAVADELRRGLSAATLAVERLTASVETLADDVQHVANELGDRLGQVADEVQTLRRRTPVRPRSAGDRDEPAAPRRPARRSTGLEG